MKKLLIVESPAKVKTISKILGKDFDIQSTKGHVIDLPTKEIGVNFDGDKHIVITYVVMENKEKVINEIIRAAKDADDIYLAPDPDREGEIIAWHINNKIQEKYKNKKKIHRIVFNEITKNAIIKAIEAPGQINENLVSAQQARRVLDRWVGYRVSPILWKKVSVGLSAGRVQSVALKLICMREEAIRSFVVKEYWTVHGKFLHSKVVLDAELVKVKKHKIELLGKEQAEDVVLECKKAKQWVVAAIKDSKRIRKPYAPFITSTLQQSAYNQLGFSVQSTMSLAQKLYEGLPLEQSSSIALITYMRTDSTRISDAALATVRSFIEKQYKSTYLPSKAHVFGVSTKKGNIQDAHECIRPVDVNITPESIKPYVEKDLYDLYDLIWKRFVACQMENAVYAQRQINISDSVHEFKVTGSVIVFDGFLKIYRDEDDEKLNEALPDGLKEGESLQLNEVTCKQHFTQPPARYTESTLVKELEKEGIGRPSTYATILKTIREREYTFLDEKKRFTPTELGMRVVKLLDEHMAKIMNIQFTAQMEEQLDEVAQGKLVRDKLLFDFYSDFDKAVNEFEGQKIEKIFEHTAIACPQNCGKHLVIKYGKGGEFLACPGFPECKFTANFTRNEQGEIHLTNKEEIKLLSVTCPSCKNQLRELEGRYGKFIACSGYPECKYIHQIKTLNNCPQCNQGKLIKRFWKNRIFWGCERYPDCAYSISGDIVEQDCAKCKGHFLQISYQNKERVLKCPNKDCDTSISAE